MKRVFFLVVFLFLGVEVLMAQQINRVIVDPTLHREVLTGLCNRKGLETGLFSTWFNSQYKNYHPDTNILKQLAPEINRVQFTVVFGSWCGDSKREMGRFFKVLDDAGYHGHPKIIAVQRTLKAGDVDISDLNIHRIPTFIVDYQGKEIGRIVESPKTSIEADLLSILNKTKDK
jgi:thiol-disulfide isomerase/thioredoxin